MSDRESEAQSAAEQLDNASDAEKGPVKPKKRRVLQKFRSQYAVKFPVVRKSTVGENYAYCLICNSNYSIGHGGLLMLPGMLNRPSMRLGLGGCRCTQNRKRKLLC